MNKKESLASKENQPWIFFGRIEAEADAPTHWPTEMKSQFIGKDPDPGKDWRQEKNGITEDEMVTWHHWLNRGEFEQTLGEREAWCVVVLWVTGLNMT